MADIGTESDFGGGRYHLVKNEGGAGKLGQSGSYLSQICEKINFSTEIFRELIL